MVVTAFAFVQLHQDDLEYELERSEVHSVNWVPLEYFRNVVSRPVESRVNFPPRDDEKPTSFPGVILPTDEVHLPQGALLKEYVFNSLFILILIGSICGA
jgi:hypothetical protein